MGTLCSHPLATAPDSPTCRRVARAEVVSGDAWWNREDPAPAPAGAGYRVGPRSASGGLAALGVLSDVAEVHHDAGLAADDFSVVAGGNCNDLAGTDLCLASIVHEDPHLPGKDVAEVRDLARVRLGDRLHVLRPAPAGLEGPLTDFAASDVDDLSLSLPLKRTCLIGGIKVLDLDSGHTASFLSTPSNLSARTGRRKVVLWSGLLRPRCLRRTQGRTPRAMAREPRRRPSRHLYEMGKGTDPRRSGGYSRSPAASRASSRV